MRQILATVGTSILTNKPSEARPWPQWKFGMPLPGAHVRRDANWIGDAEVLTVSAETNTLARLGILEVPNETMVVLLHTDTPEGAFCADHLAAFLTSRAIGTEVEKVPYLGNNPEHFYRGLSELVGALLNRIEKEPASEIVATGGFKPEAAAAALVGSLKNIPVHYVHEKFRECVSLPLLPVSIDLDRFDAGALKALFAKLPRSATIARSEVESLLSRGAELSFLVDEIEIEGAYYVSRSVLGQLAADALSAGLRDAEWPKESGRSPSEKVDVSKEAHHRPRNSETVVGTLARNCYVESVRVDNGIGRTRGVGAAADSASDVIVVVTDDTAPPLRLRVTTTARSSGQRDMIMSLLREKLAPVMR